MALQGCDLRTETAEMALLAVANRDGGSRRHSWWSRTGMANEDGSGRAVAAPGWEIASDLGEFGYCK
nr:hypothetical protein Iba_chr15dCG7230 [Ipomoea batatas]